jgi:hypothetical protein
MGVSFNNVVARVVLRMAQARVEEMRARYHLGGLLREARRGKLDLQAAAVVASLHSVTRIHPSALRRHARVAETMGNDEFASLTSLRGSDGLPLTWSHLELLSEVRPAARRRELAELAVCEGLSVRRLAARIRRDA